MLGDRAASPRDRVEDHARSVELANVHEVGNLSRVQGGTKGAVLTCNAPMTWAVSRIGRLEQGQAQVQLVDRRSQGHRVGWYDGTKRWPNSVLEHLASGVIDDPVYRACDKLVNREPGAEKLEFIPIPGSWFPAHQFSDRVLDHTPSHLVVHIRGRVLIAAQHLPSLCIKIQDCTGHDLVWRIMSNARHALEYALFVGLALGCATPTAAPPASAQPQAPPPTAPVAPEPAPLPEATAPADKPGPELGPSPLHIVGEHSGLLQVFGLGDVGFALAGDHLFEVRDGQVRYDRDPNRGLPTGEAYEAIEVAGEWPDTAFVVATRTDHDHRRTELFFWDGRRWKSKLQTQRSTVIRTLAPWNLRRVLALLQDGHNPSFRVVAGFPLHPVPQPTKSTQQDCRAEVLHQVATIARSGHVFAAGSRCGPTPAEAAVEHWNPGSKKGEIQNLPESSGVEVTGIVALDAATVFVAGTSNQSEAAYLAKSENEGWKRVEVPMKTGITQLVTGPDATLWVVTQSGTLWKQAEGSWTQIPMPKVPTREDRMKASSVWPKAKDDTWVVARYDDQGQSRSVLLHSQAHDAKMSFEVPR